MNTPQLNFHPPESRKRIPYRPLDALSTYVTLHMGDDLQAVAKKQLSAAAFAERCDILSKDAVEPLISLDSDDALAVAHLDSMMLPQALQAVGQEMPAHVRSLYDTLNAKDQDSAPILTYEDIVLRNPVDDPRAFTRGDIGASELFFYEIHRHIEKELTEIRKKIFGELLRQTHMTLLLRGVTKDMSQMAEFPHETEECCITILPHLSEVKASMQSLFGKLELSHFTGFRPYFSPRVDPKHGRLPGPSGNYSPGMYCFDGLCIGKQPLMRQLNASKDAERKFFPRRATSPMQYEIQSHMDDVQNNLNINGITLEDFRETFARGKCVEVMQLMKDIRDIHVETFKKFIGSGLGTALKAPEYLTLAPRAYEAAISQQL